MPASLGNQAINRHHRLGVLGGMGSLRFRLPVTVGAARWPRPDGGRAVGGARNREEKAPHLVAALAHGIGGVLGQVAAAAKSSEIPAVRELLKAFTDLAGAVITAGALHAQGGTAQAITGRVPAT